MSDSPSTLVALSSGSAHGMTALIMGLRLYWSVFQLLVQISLGQLIFFLIHSFTGGEWGQRLRPVFLKTFARMPYLLILLLPALLFASFIFPWATPANQHTLSNEALIFRRWILNPLWFDLRSLAYLAIWCVFAWRLRKGERSNLERGLMLLVLLHTISWAGMDWIMTLDPAWSSTGFGVMYIITCLNAGVAVGLLSLLPQGPAPFKISIDFANLLLMSLLLWIYMNFMQYLVIWSAHLPEEMHWYQVRAAGGWASLLTVILVLHFVIPFPVLLMRGLKSRASILLAISTGFVLAQFLENILWVLP